MRQEERLGLILDRLARDGSVSVADLTGELGASPASVRRDLRVLEEQQLLKRTHGGAVSAEVLYELPIRYRSGRHHEEKLRIAQAAARLVTDAVHSVGLGGGTTTTELARILGASARPLKVITNALNIAGELSVRPAVDLVVTGGSVRSASYELVGPLAEQALAGINLDIAFIGVDGIEASRGISTHDDVEAQTDRSFLRTADQVVVLTDGSKVGKRAFSRIAGIDEITMLVTDSGADAAELDRLRAAGVEVTIV
ncbi:MULTISPECIES: DeoR/GlpR family DNA-binding transcription regulator [Actinoallomurus]|uniref:DeoR/GlpR family DNA-binding transcription regulator n=1 Tax=Actinoallomurus TaxID=667113 RepID=UPI002091E8DD|nr:MULTISPECIES: DeoR/GlpR family DNA-binding transcription regulator [Actinoallomurus]MCO5971787.1 DeoR/GlpR family DNA-binding transcription regulator [Actinoallomurus soli]MCO5998861.1 DeoR/GlpR family DNA-binding transcription regulator [Actinoallomurus rhizosphaericola]